MRECRVGGRRELVLGRSLSKFMRTLGVYSSSGGTQTRLRNQMRRLFNAHVQLIYEDELGEASVSSSVADRTELAVHGVAPTFVLKYNIRTRSLAHPGTIEDVLAVENDVVPFDRADVFRWRRWSVRIDHLFVMCAAGRGYPAGTAFYGVF